MTLISDKQAETSRRNGAQSRGPVSAEGKARSSQNAFKHGMHSRLVVLQNEDPAKYNQLREHYVSEWQPKDQRETDLVDDFEDTRGLLVFSRFETRLIRTIDRATTGSNASSAGELKNAKTNPACRAATPACQLRRSLLSLI